ncbi:MAG: DUF2332 domain-containing protein [Dehalococcoidia bacterium]|nr:DUF2332 domain-containing protein [Dehalococcoidia bacterium]
MTPDQIDGHQGRGRVEQLLPSERTDEALAERFRVFAREECSGMSGLNVMSPTYETLSVAIADNPGLLALARECMVGQPIPNLFFAAVKRISDSRCDELAEHYTRIGEGGVPGCGLTESFARFCARHESEIVELVRTRRVQTNEIRRCSYLMPAFGTVFLDAGELPLALIDVGASAGLNLLWESYQYRYSNGSVFGPSDAEVVIECELRNDMPDIPKEMPDVVFRMGVDLNPVDLGDDEQFLWMMALVWPDHPDRAALLRAARRVWLNDPPRVERGDALEVLPRVLAEVPCDTALCVFHCHTLNQFPAESRNAFYEILDRESFDRSVYHVSSEGEYMRVNRIVGGVADTILSARRNAHGRWIEWLSVQRQETR